MKTEHEEKLIQIIEKAKADEADWNIALDCAYDYHHNQSSIGSQSFWDFNESIGLRKYQDASASTWYICQLIDRVYGK